MLAAGRFCHLDILWTEEDLPLAAALQVFACGCCWLAYRLASRPWSEREGRLAAALLAFFLIFDYPAAVLGRLPPSAVRRLSQKSPGNRLVPGFLGG